MKILTYYVGTKFYEIELNFLKLRPWFDMDIDETKEKRKKKVAWEEILREI